MGIEHRFNDNFKLYGSFNSDFSATKENSRANLNFPAIDLFHFSGGVLFRIGPSDFTLGGTYATGDTGDNERQTGDLLPEEISVSFKRLSLVIGVNLPF